MNIQLFVKEYYRIKEYFISSVTLVFKITFVDVV